MKTLYIDIDEQITEVVKKVSALKGRQILLVIPRKAVLFNNVIHFKILKKAADKEGKELQIFTNDDKGLQMINKSGIKKYQGHLRKRNTVKTAQISRLPKEAPQQIGKRVSITEVSEKSRHQSAQHRASSPQKKRKKKEQREWTTFFLFNTLRKKTLLGFSSVALLFFFVVLYIAIPSATITLSPSSNVLEGTVNVTFADVVNRQDLFRNPSNHSIPSLALDLSFEKQILYKPTGKVFTGSSARCNIKLYNERTSAWTLVPKTRLKENGGVIFRTNDDLEVPAARFEVIKDEEGNATRQKIPGSLIVSVLADEFDENENIIGARGNVPAETKFFLPGLSTFNQSLLYAINEKPCIGGVTEFYPIVTENDLIAAQEKIIDVLEAEAHQYLIDFIDGENVKRAELEQEGDVISRIALFDNSQTIKYEVLNTEVPPNLEDKRMEEFSVSGEMRVQGIAYEEQTFFELLEQGLLARVHPQKVLSRIDFDSATQNIVYSDSNLDSLEKIKVSVTVRGIEEYNFDPRTEEGKKVIERIMQYVPGKTNLDAHYFIANLEQIQKAHISIWPFWKGELPARRSSIKINVK
jgi:hypothetical protein